MRPLTTIRKEFTRAEFAKLPYVAPPRQDGGFWDGAIHYGTYVLTHDMKRKPIAVYQPGLDESQNMWHIVRPVVRVPMGRRVV